ncbi:MAG: amidophosphoribosyltransferase, partial [Lachnospiraceae bacterium]|nr:amidophosphoribosyltransferase [Lachnospiraceae bacterium]
MDKIHEECGVFGIYNHPGHDAAQDVYNGLTALQHRGQESAGISVSDTEGDRGNLALKKGMGLVSEVFTEEDISGLKGNIGIGHVRYSTAGGSTYENAQPVAMRYIKGSLALVHNGNIINAEDLKHEQMERGQAHYTTSDSELIAYEIVSERIKSNSVEEAVLGASKKLKGGYACIVMSPRKLIGIRDPLGIKPLVIGKRDDDYILASESAAIESTGGKMIRDVEPGELIIISKNGISGNRSLCGARAAHCVFEYIYFARNDSVIDGIEVYGARLRSGKALSRINPVDADIVSGIPDSGIAAAKGYSEASSIPFAFIFHKNSYIGRSFIKPTQEERNISVKMKLNILKSEVKGKRIVLIDDSIVRGTTMKQIVKML